MGESRPAAGASGSRRNPPQAAVAVGSALRPAPGLAADRPAAAGPVAGSVSGSAAAASWGPGSLPPYCSQRGGSRAYGSSRSRNRAWCCAFGEYDRTMDPGFNWAPYFIDSVDTVNVDRIRNAEIGFRNQGSSVSAVPSRGAHADRGREHRRPPVRGAVSGEGSRAIPLREQRAGDRAAPGDGECGARDRRPVEDGLRAHRRPRRGGGRDARD